MISDDIDAVIREMEEVSKDAPIVVMEGTLMRAYLNTIKASVEQLKAWEKSTGPAPAAKLNPLTTNEKVVSLDSRRG